MKINKINENKQINKFNSSSERNLALRKGLRLLGPTPI